ncbi:MAG: DMT family transporter [Gemmatimonadota bacterium]|nr:DMT family transporter [Gemmatimonadota bacterium]
MRGNIDRRGYVVYVSRMPPALPEPAGTPSRAAILATDASLVLMAIIWGVNFSVVKYGAAQMSPLVFNSGRLLLAAAALSLLAFVPRPAPIARRDAVALLLLGVLGNGIYQWLFIEGVSRTRAGDAALVVAASPAFIALISKLRGVDRVSARGVGGIALSIVGIGFVVYSGSRVVVRGASVGGDLLVLAGSLSWAVYTVWLAPYTKRVDGITLSTYTMIGGAVTLSLVSAPELAHMAWSTVSVGGWAAVLYSGLGSLVLAYLFWYRGVRVIGPTKTAMYSNLQPLVALIVAGIMLGEHPTPWQLVGAVCIMAGLVLTRA